MKVVITQQQDNFVWILLFIINNRFKVVDSNIISYPFYIIWIRVIPEKDYFLIVLSFYCFLPEVTTMDIWYDEYSFFHFFGFLSLAFKSLILE